MAVSAAHGEEPAGASMEPPLPAPGDDPWASFIAGDDADLRAVLERAMRRGGEGKAPSP